MTSHALSGIVESEREQIESAALGAPLWGAPSFGLTNLMELLNFYADRSAAFRQPSERFSATSILENLPTLSGRGSGMPSANCRYSAPTWSYDLRSRTPTCSSEC